MLVRVDGIGNESSLQLTVMHEFGNAGNRSRPSAYENERENHLGRDTAVETQKDGPFGVTGDIEGSNLEKLVGDTYNWVKFWSQFDPSLKTWTYKVVLNI